MIRSLIFCFLTYSILNQNQDTQVIQTAEVDNQVSLGVPEAD